jgi:hypothetical protein
MIKASYLQKQATKYRELARAEASLEMRRQLFALASRCDELAAMMARWPGPKDLVRSEQVRSERRADRARSDQPKKLPAPEAAPPAPLRFADGTRARLVHGLFAEQ